APDHEVLSPLGFGFYFTNLISLPGFSSFGTNFLGGNFFSGGWGVAVNTNRTGPSNTLVQVVFYPTNSIDPDASVDVRFSGGIVTVAFHSSEFDIATQTTSSNALYLLDGLASSTTLSLSRHVPLHPPPPTPYQPTPLPPSPLPP